MRKKLNQIKAHTTNSNAAVEKCVCFLTYNSKAFVAIKSQRENIPEKRSGRKNKYGGRPLLFEFAKANKRIQFLDKEQKNICRIKKRERKFLPPRPTTTFAFRSQTDRRTENPRHLTKIDFCLNA